MTPSVIKNVKYITDEKGKRQEVVIPFKIWSSVTEELEKLREKQQILLGLKHACREAKRQEKGKLPEQSLDEFINEL